MDPPAANIRLFISYASEDEDTASSVAQTARQAGLEVTKLPPSPVDDFGTILQQALEEADYLLLVHSPSSVNSTWVVREWTYFLRDSGIDRVLVVEAPTAQRVPSLLVDATRIEVGDELALRVRFAEMLRHEALRSGVEIPNGLTLATWTLAFPTRWAEFVASHAAAYGVALAPGFGWAELDPAIRRAPFVRQSSFRLLFTSFTLVVLAALASSQAMFYLGMDDLPRSRGNLGTTAATSLFAGSLIAVFHSTLAGFRAALGGGIAGAIACVLVGRSSYRGAIPVSVAVGAAVGFAASAGTVRRTGDAVRVPIGITALVSGLTLPAILFLTAFVYFDVTPHLQNQPASVRSLLGAAIAIAPLLSGGALVFASRAVSGRARDFVRIARESSTALLWLLFAGAIGGWWGDGSSVSLRNEVAVGLLCGTLVAAFWISSQRAIEDRLPAPVVDFVGLVTIPAIAWIVIPLFGGVSPQLRPIMISLSLATMAAYLVGSALRALGRQLGRS